TRGIRIYVGKRACLIEAECADPCSPELPPPSLPQVTRHDLQLSQGLKERYGRAIAGIGRGARRHERTVMGEEQYSRHTQADRQVVQIDRRGDEGGLLIRHDCGHNRSISQPAEVRRRHLSPTSSTVPEWLPGPKVVETR